MRLVKILKINYPVISSTYCRVLIFGLDPESEWDLGPADPVQWICKEWVKEQGFNEFYNG